MSGLSIFVQAATGQFEAAMEEATREVKGASMFAAHAAADIIKREGRADIAAAGFGSKWQNTLKTVVYPQHTVSAHPSVQVYHLISYSQIFEDGGSIFGQPTLWLPLPGAPTHIGRDKITPEIFVKRIGPLFPIVRPGHRPLLAANIDTNRRGQRGPGSPPVTLSALRRGASPGKKTEAVPLFVGISSVTLRDRFSIKEIAEKAAAKLPELFAKEFGKG